MTFMLTGCVTENRDLLKCGTATAATAWDAAEDAKEDGPAEAQAKQSVVQEAPFSFIYVLCAIFVATNVRRTVLLWDDPSNDRLRGLTLPHVQVVTCQGVASGASNS